LDRKAPQDDAEHGRLREQLVSEFVARAGAGGFTVQELIDSLRDRLPEDKKRR
jgi:hypothetical protein